MTIEQHDEASRELDSAVAWYEQRRQGLGAEFIQELDNALERLVHGPESFPVIITTPDYPPIRRAPVVRFPYSIIYYSRDRRIIVVAVAHHSRRPGYWTSRLDRP